MSKRQNPGWFRPGDDPRRHQFTREECERGYQAAMESIARRYPGCDPHFMMCAMIGSKPIYHFWPKWEDYPGMTCEQIEATLAARYER